MLRSLVELFKIISSNGRWFFYNFSNQVPATYLMLKGDVFIELKRQCVL